MENELISLYGSLCLSDIPKELISTGNNGKKYLNISIRQRREPSQWGHTHNVLVDIPQEQRVKGSKAIYIGNLKVSAPKPPQSDTTKDLPF